MSTLRYLVFDFSDDADDTGSFEAMASVAPSQAAEVEAEIAAVLDWARQRFAGRQGPVEEGGEWDHDLQSSREPGTPERQVFHLSIGGTAAFCAAFTERFGDAVA